MSKLKKGDVVRFKEGVIEDILERERYFANELKNIQEGDTHNVEGIANDGSILLDGYGGILFESNMFVRVCIVCLKKEVFKQHDTLDKCYECTMKYCDKMYEEFRASLLPDQIELFEKYQKARSDKSSVHILD